LQLRGRARRRTSAQRPTPWSACPCAREVPRRGHQRVERARSAGHAIGRSLGATPRLPAVRPGMLAAASWRTTWPRAGVMKGR
jgi:hypothetical protein